MKAGKEEIMGLLTAVEAWILGRDHEAEWRVLEKRVSEMIQALSGAEGLRAERYVPKIANEVPHVMVSWDEKKSGKTAQAIIKALRAGSPPIAVLDNGPGALLVSVWMMQGAEHRVVARRIREILALSEAARVVR
jgi:L-seryl-tRNA(Ser) seleniumtransferase